MSDCITCEYRRNCTVNPMYCHSWTPNAEWYKQREKRKMSIAKPNEAK